MKKFAIVKNRKIFFMLSAALLLLGILSFLIRGFNFDIDFVGGTTFNINIGQSLDRAELDKIAELVKEVTGVLPSSVQKTGNQGDGVIIKTHSIDSETRDAVFAKLKEAYNLSDEDKLMVDNVSPTVGEDLKDRALLSVSVASLLMLVYITIRFDLRSGLAAVIALLHDIFVMLTVYSLFQVPMDTTFIAAGLTILGYSINATIIVFDRVRENRKFAKKESFEDTVERSIWQTMRRSVNTTVTTLLTVVMLYILGVTSVKNFAFPLIVGILAGLYSSVFLSGSLWVTFSKIGVKNKK